MFTTLRVILKSVRHQTVSDGEFLFLESWGVWSYFFIPITPKSTLILYCSICLGPVLEVIDLFEKY